MISEILTHAPIQTRENTVDKQERYLALLAVEAYRKILSYVTGKEYPVVDVWNTVGTKSESDYLTHRKPDQGYGDYHDEQIRRRYILLQTIYGLDWDKRRSLTDYEPDYVNICLRRTQELIVQGEFEVRHETFCHCPSCEYTIAPLVSGIKKCPNCGSSQVDCVDKIGMFAVVSDESRERMKRESRVHPRAALGELKRIICTLPPVYQLSKQRQYGISLEKFGVDPIFILDPKIALAMMGLVISEMGIGNLNTLFQGIDSLANTVPCFSLVDPDRQMVYVALGMIPSFTRETVKPDNQGFYRSFLPLMMISNPSGVNSEGVLGMFKCRSRTIGKYRHIVDSSEKSDSTAPDTQQESMADSIIIKEVLTLITSYKIAEAFNLLREYTYSKLGNRIERDGVNPISELFGLLYDQS